MEIVPSGRERSFSQDELIVSKTDPQGKITYANRVFLRVAGYDERELLGVQHNIIRHPEMPRCVFRFLWDTIGAKREIFAYVLNLCKNGDHYWVFAHVTPSLNDAGEIIGYHSSRRVPERRAIDAIAPVYKSLHAEERKHSSPRQGLEASTGMLLDYLGQRGGDYEQFVFSL
ncbi:MAG: PAS domain-containing protein [Gammaproteobacteria bacterium]|nr:PAS domain-containing protein [Gammaproteobacteria bacterium]